MGGIRFFTADLNSWQGDNFSQPCTSLYLELHENENTHDLFVKLFLDKNQLSLPNNDLYLRIQENNNTIEKSLSTFNYLSHLNDLGSNNVTLKYFKKYLTSTIHLLILLLHNKKLVKS